MDKHDERARAWLERQALISDRITAANPDALAAEFRAVDAQARREQREADARVRDRRGDLNDCAAADARTVLDHLEATNRAIEARECAAAIREGGE